MGGCLKGCVGRVAAVAVLLAVGAYAGWRWGPDAFPRLERFVRGETAEAEAAGAPSPELAEATLDRFERFRAAGATESQLVLGETELSSLVRYSLPGILPAGVADPAVELAEGRIFLSAEVALSSFPELRLPEEVRGLLPDTVPIRIGGSLGPGSESSAMLYVDEVRAGPLPPLPDRFIPPILSALGREGREDLAPNAMTLPLPEGLRRVYVRRDSLVLEADR
jgi:hypothetical protein